MNSVALVGRLTANPELKQTPNGLDVCTFTVAVDRYSKEGDKKADFINCVAWRTTALFISRYFTKGQFLGLTGSISTRQYTDKETGKNRTAFEVVCDKAYFTESKKATADIPVELDDFSAVADSQGDLPFDLGF